HKITTSFHQDYQDKIQSLALTNTTNQSPHYISTSAMTTKQLKIYPTPFKPSHLSIPPSPFSPLTPLTLPALPKSFSTYPAPDAAYPHPPSPLQWVWQCHQCARIYSLGVTRRCLEDGHLFCSGTTTLKTWRKSMGPRKKVKRHQACGSEFDYQGWKVWGRWRRSGHRDSMDDEDGPSKDCWNKCDYPSECRWGRQFGVHTPLLEEFPPLEAPNKQAAPEPSEGVLKVENVKDAGVGKKAEKTDFWGALLASATRRRSVPPSSPLTDQAQTESEGDKDKDGDGDTIMSTVDSVGVAAATAAAPTVTKVKEIIRKTRGKRTKALNCKASQSSNPVQVAPAAAAIGDFDFGLGKQDEVAELAPLERVKSRDSGYHSIDSKGT
ncbi:hypothetical protein EJ04DRAFT_590013, partial [Polyplosphaeria fusca]